MAVWFRLVSVSLSFKKHLLSTFYGQGIELGHFKDSFIKYWLSTYYVPEGRGANKTKSLFLSNLLTSGRVRWSIINLQRVISPVTKIKPGEGLGSVGGYRDMFRFCGLRSLWVGVMWAETCLNPGASHMGIWGKRSVPSRVNSKYEGPEVKMSQAQCLEQDELGRECLWWDQGEW